MKIARCLKRFSAELGMSLHHRSSVNRFLRYCARHDDLRVEQTHEDDLRCTDRVGKDNKSASMAFFSWPFTASKIQVVTYLFCVALFSISFLVFLNASVSFVVTDLIGQDKGVGDAVGSLGFADELVALIACPIWGLLSDKVGVRTVCVTGYMIVGISLFVFVQARDVYPQLLLARMLFSVGGAATTTMVTAVLPTMTTRQLDVRENTQFSRPATSRDSDHAPSLSTASEATEATITPARYQAHSTDRKSAQSKPSRSNTSQVAGLVGAFTGLGALIALGIFLPLPTRFSQGGYDRGEAITASFYVVGGIALLVAVFCLLGLRNLPGEHVKGIRTLFSAQETRGSILTLRPRSSLSLLRQSLVLGFTDLSISIGYIGGFVARASSVGISLFIPLFINAYFIRSGLCPTPSHGQPSDPSDVKAHCRRAYTLAAALSGVSQVVAMVCAPLFGWADGRLGARYNGPLMFAALAGIIGYMALAMVEQPDQGGVVWVCMILVGMSQIGAIVCSLSSLSRGIENEIPDNGEDENDHGHDSRDVSGRSDDAAEEHSALMPRHLHDAGKAHEGSRAQLKGTIAGLYSLSGGAGILLLTKLGGYLFDKTNEGAPFYMLAIFNAILLIVTATCTTLKHAGPGRRGVAI